MKLNEVRKEDELYFQGPFWIEGESVKDIKLGDFNIVSFRYFCNANGDPLEILVYEKKEDIDYYPRGRVDIYIMVLHI